MPFARAAAACPMPVGIHRADTRIRLQRLVRKRYPFFRIVAAHKYAPRDGKFKEILGTYNPVPDRFGAKNVTLNVERIKYWLCVGAAPSPRVLQLLGRAELVPPPPRRRRSLLEEFAPEVAMRWEEKRALAAASGAEVVQVVDPGGVDAGAGEEPMEVDDTSAGEGDGDAEGEADAPQDAPPQPTPS